MSIWTGADIFPPLYTKPVGRVGTTGLPWQRDAKVKMTTQQTAEFMIFFWFFKPSEIKEIKKIKKKKKIQL